MMSMVLGLMFGAFGLFAVGTMLAALRRLAPAVASLRQALRQPTEILEIRTTLLEQMLVRLRPNRGPLRHMHRPKPVTHRLPRRPSRAA